MSLKIVQFYIPLVSILLSLQGYFGALQPICPLSFGICIYTCISVDMTLLSSVIAISSVFVSL